MQRKTKKKANWLLAVQILFYHDFIVETSNFVCFENCNKNWTQNCTFVLYLFYMNIPYSGKVFTIDVLYFSCHYYQRLLSFSWQFWVNFNLVCLQWRHSQFSPQCICLSNFIIVISSPRFLISPTLFTAVVTPMSEIWQFTVNFQAIEYTQRSLKISETRLLKYFTAKIKLILKLIQ